MPELPVRSNATTDDIKAETTDEDAKATSSDAKTGGSTSAVAGSSTLRDTNKAQSEFITLVSSDGFEFIVLRSAALVSGTIRRMLDPQNGFAEARTNRCEFGSINGVVLEKVCEYFYHFDKWKNEKDVPDMYIPPELCLELLMAADYLNT